MQMAGNCLLIARMMFKKRRHFVELWLLRQLLLLSLRSSLQRPRRRHG
jgi:hypothetical protein